MSQQKLLAIYKLFDLWAKDFTFACRQGCSTCCTQSVSITMLEGELIFDYIKSEKPKLLAALKELPESRFTPQSTNQFAQACLDEEQPEDNSEQWDMSPCVFLHNDSCSIYPVRSFMCRSLGSQVPCTESGEAVMDPLFLTLNTIIMQCIEHLDKGRPWGNMYTILRLIIEGREEQSDEQGNRIRISQPIPGFLIPPEEANQVDNQLKTLLDIISSQYP